MAAEDEEMDSLEVFMDSLHVPDNAPPPADARADWTHHVGTRDVQTNGESTAVKNRRYRYLQQLLQTQANDGAHYFSDDSMKRRAPGLFHFHLGQYLYEQGSSGELGGFSSFLLVTQDRHRLEAQRQAEQRAWGDNFVGEDEAAERRRMQRLLEEDEVEEEEEDEMDQEDTIRPQRSPAWIDKQRQELIDVMSMRFLHGEDNEYVDYDKIDKDESLDDDEQINQDAQDRYFDMNTTSA